MAKEKKQKITPEQQLLDTGMNLASHWLDFRKFFRKAFSNQPIAQDEEHHFLKIKSEITRIQRILAQNLPEGLDYGVARINNVMTQAISIETLREMPANDKKSLYDEWHAAYIRIQNMLGVLDVIAQGHKVKFAVQRVKSANIKESIGAIDTNKKDGKFQKYLMKAVVLAAVGAAVWYFLLRG